MRAIRTPTDLDELRFTPSADGEAGGGLVAVIAQDARTGAVLMLAWANREALVRTLESGEMHYWSRSRKELWHKGATSGNTQRVLSLHSDCDGDTVLALVESAGPACHTGEETCFGAGGTREGAGAGSAAPPSTAWLADLWRTLEARAAERPEGSYTTRLLGDENLRMKKLGEETAELILAFAKKEEDRIPEEAADLLYHLLVALLASGHSLDELGAALEHRRR